MTQQTKKWLKGLAATAIATTANTVSGLIMLPSVFNFTKAGLINTARCIAIPTIAAVCFYIKSSPLSDVTATVDDKGNVTNLEGSVDVTLKSSKN